MDFADRLDLLIKQNGITAYRLSKELGFSESSVSQWKKNTDSYPSVPLAYRIAEFFDVNIDWLLRGAGQQGKFNKDEQDRPDSGTGINVRNLSADEKDLVINWRILPESERYRILGNIEARAEIYALTKSLPDTTSYIELDTGEKLISERIVTDSIPIK